MSESQWQTISAPAMPSDWAATVQRVAKFDSPPHYGAQLLWQRGIRSENQLQGFLNSKNYRPASPFDFSEMTWAVDRLVQARQQGEKVAIWGDFDADGVTSTAVLWDGLGQFFTQHEQLTYFIPNRLKESHGLSKAGLAALAEQGVGLIVTCDTGSTNLAEIAYAKALGMETIVTDHHTLPPERPPVVAMINPRVLPADHPLAHLSGVAVAFKLVEALYEKLPEVPARPLESLLDLVAIGLIADLVQLTGDCRYLAQRGIQQLKIQRDAQTRPGVARLLELCRRTGDRPTDISFGIGPRINAVSRIQGDASFCVELLTSQDAERCHELAQVTELANARRKALQSDVLYQVQQRLAEQDLSTTRVIVLADAQWPAGVLGIVAGQVAQETGKPTILFTLDETAGTARGSARSANNIDLYELVDAQAHLLDGFGGHPFAAGMSLPIDNLPLFRDAINRQLRQAQARVPQGRVITADLTVTASELGSDLFEQISLLEPCGMGNALPKLLIEDCWFERVWNKNISDPGSADRAIKYIKTSFILCDRTCPTGFPGVWWGHYKEEIPSGRCDVICELDYNSFVTEKHPKGRYEIRLVDMRLAQGQTEAPAHRAQLIDQRQRSTEADLDPRSLILTDCPTGWQTLRPWYQQALQQRSPLVLAYGRPEAIAPEQTWTTLLGIAKYLSRTGKSVSSEQLAARLKMSVPLLNLAIEALKSLGFERIPSNGDLSFRLAPAAAAPQPQQLRAAQNFVAKLKEEQFQQQYFYQVPLETAQTVMSAELSAEIK